MTTEHKPNPQPETDQASSSRLQAIRSVPCVNGSEAPQKEEATVLPAEGVPGTVAFPSSSEEKRKRLRAALAVRPTTTEERQQHEDMSWALQDLDVQANYQGQIVVPYQRKIVAHGTDVKVVLEEAMRATSKRADELPLVPIVDLLQDIRPD